MDQVLVGVPAVLWVGLLVWVTVFGGAASFVASTKGRDTIAWFLLGVLIGPFATVVVGLAGESHEGTSWARCGAYLEPVRTGATRCPHCQVDFG